MTQGTTVQDDMLRVIQNIGRVIVGKETPIQQLTIALMCSGHVLIEDLPGVGKTILARSLARSTDCEIKRIQFTPDLLPSDITGVNIFNQKTREFEFRAGPIITQILLADEINRASPKTQSALLEAMGESQVTVDGISHPTPKPFLLLATQNSIEYEASFPLPEGQLDRFLLRITLGYPTFHEEIKIIENQKLDHPLENLQAVITHDRILEAQESARRINVHELVKQYIVAIVTATRNHQDIALGASPRGSLALFKTSQALALLEGRDFVLPDDVKIMAIPVLAHRIHLSHQAMVRGATGDQIIAALLEKVPIPGFNSSSASLNRNS